MAKDIGYLKKDVERLEKAEMDRYYVRLFQGVAIKYWDTCGSLTECDLIEDRETEVKVAYYLDHAIWVPRSYVLKIPTRVNEAIERTRLQNQPQSPPF